MAGIEVVDEISKSNHLFEKIKLTKDHIELQLETKRPFVRFFPIDLPENERYEYSVVYTVAITLDPDLLTYYSNCNTKYLNKLLKPQF